MAWKVSIFGVIQVRIFLHLDWITRENTDQNNSEYGHFLRSIILLIFANYTGSLHWGYSDLDSKGISFEVVEGSNRIN